MSNEDPVNHAGVHIARLGRNLELLAKFLRSDLWLLHTDQTKQGKPKKLWHRGAAKRIAALRQLLEMAEEDLQEVGKAWEE